jgi:hypothetical protein
MEEAVRCLTLLACLAFVAACSRERPSGTGAPADSTWQSDSLPAGEELIPAEWMVNEDTSADGQITTASLQLPSARDIARLLPNESPRLILRCVDYRVAAYIDADPSREPDSTMSEPVTIQLDSAPSCE